jgi:EAL domain-containing protein (putative c-di-GMP-specific phosphodiesterase class I)
LCCLGRVAKKVCRSTKNRELYFGGNQFPENRFRFAQSEVGSSLAMCIEPIIMNKYSNTLNSGSLCMDTVDSVKEIPWTLTGRPHENSADQQVTIGGHSFTVGRHAENSLSIQNPTVSGCHSEILRVKDKLFVRDLESTNGTLLNGRRLQGIAELCDGDVIHFGNAMYTLKESGAADLNATVETDAAEIALGQIQFDKLINTPKISPVFQPIVRLDTREFVAYEALSRSQLIGLETPDKMFRIAEQRGATARLSEVCRSEALRVGCPLGTEVCYYLNTHPSELGTAQLINSLTSLRETYSDLPLVLEVHESSVTSAAYLRELSREMRNLNISLAYDDFGSGQTRLMELAEVPPEVLKFDISIIRGLPTATKTHRSTIESLVKIASDLNVIPLAEGVETEEEVSACWDVGFELAQGYLFGRPERVAHWLPSE